MAYTIAATQSLLDLAGGDHIAVLEALNAAAQEIDEAFGYHGYNTPLDLSLIVGVESRLRLQTKIEVTEQAIAARLLSSAFATGAKKAVSSKVEKDYQIAQRWLARVRESGVPQLGLAAGNRFGVGVTGDEEWDVTPYFDTMQSEIWD